MEDKRRISRVTEREQKREQVTVEAKRIIAAEREAMLAKTARLKELRQKTSSGDKG
jgi:hypothetical protein